MPKASNQFTVSIEGLALSGAQKKQLNAAIQKATLAELAGLGLRGGLGTHFPREWMGIWIGPIRGYDARAAEAVANTKRR